MSNAGAPTKKTPELVNKLLAAFNNGYNITEACDYSGISRETYYSWLEEDIELSDKIEQSKRLPNRKAKENIIENINAGDPKWSAWWLERKDPEFKNKSDLTFNPQEAKYEEALEMMLNDPANRPENLPDDGEEATDIPATAD